MGLVLSVFSLLGNVKEVAQWYRNINGNLFTYWQLARKQKNGQFSNKRFKLHDLSKTNDPRHLALIPFEEEWQLECPSKVSYRAKGEPIVTLTFSRIAPRIFSFTVPTQMVKY